MSSTVLVGISATVRPNDIIFGIKITVSCENFFISEHHVCHFITIDVLPDPYAARFSYWFFILLQFLNINFSIAFLSEIFSKYSSDTFKGTFDIFRHFSYTFSTNLKIKPLCNQIDEMFCMFFWPSCFSHNINQVRLFVPMYCALTKLICQ